MSQLDIRLITEQYCFYMETIKWVQGLLAFVKVSEVKSFSKAAKALGVSKSHISKTIKSLEEEVGQSLFSRSTRKVQLTSAGETFFDQCKETLEKLEDTKLDLMAPKDHPKGLLRVTMAGVFGENFIAPVLIQMAKKYPDLKIEMNFDSKVVDLIEEKFDVGIRVGHLQDSSLFATKIASRREFICASPDYIKKMGKPKNPEDLKNHNCLGETKSWSFKEHKKIKKVALKGNLTSNNPRVLLMAALSHVGIIKLPGSYVFEEIKNKKLVSLLEDYTEEHRDIWAITPIKSKLNINIAVFIEEVKKFLAHNYNDVLF